MNVLEYAAIEAPNLAADQQVIRQERIGSSPIFFGVIFQQDGIEGDVLQPDKDIDLRAFRVDFQNLGLR